MKGLLAFSFGLTDKEPNECNERLALAVRRIIEKESEGVVVVSQWGIALALKGLGVPIGLTVEKHRKGEYLDSNEVMAQAAAFFKENGIIEVIPVAQPFLHLFLCSRLIKKSGFKPVKRPVAWIGFCGESKQPWTRGPVRLLLYAVKRALTGRRGR